ncbi:MAG: flagellar export chaperone FliS [Proteobacteria bacterium]|nr:flagellar export chaperone FliS [Pseudomonadota bacterium]MBU1715784.1 flagellar export chaperone FliS [Pseudomonadota bacterium]
MVSNRVRNVYGQLDSQAKIHPVKLIHMMYERVLIHFDLAEAGINEKDPRKRGENLGKALTIITELNASIKADDKSEAAAFLRGMYGAIMVELPKVSFDNDLKVLHQARGYISRLKDIWEQTAMKESGFEASVPAKQKVAVPKLQEKVGQAVSADISFRGLSVSI